MVAVRVRGVLAAAAAVVVALGLVVAGQTQAAAEPARTVQPVGSVSNTTTDASTPAVATSSGTMAMAIGGTGTVTVSNYPSNPAAATTKPAAGSFMDVSVSKGSTFSLVMVMFCALNRGTALQWWNPDAVGDAAWQNVVSNPQDISRMPGCLMYTFTKAGSSPTIGQLGGTIFAAVDPTSTARIAGSDRFSTAADIAQQYVKVDSAFTDNVVVANGVNAKQGFDALSANFLAGMLHAPILLTAAASLPTPTAGALKTLFSGAAKGTIYVMGETDSVSAAVENQMKTIAATAAGHAVTVVRVAGASRYATSADAATKAGNAEAFSLTAGGPKLKTAFVASGQVNADALAAGSASFGLHIPVLLTEPNALPAPVAQAIKTLGIGQVIILGGTDRISNAVVDSLKALGVSVTKRVAGSDRFATAADIYTLARASLGQHGDGVYLANGLTGFPDALSVGPLAGAAGSPILTVPQASLPASTKAFLTGNKTGLTTITALGKDATITQAVLTAANSALH